MRMARIEEAASERPELIEDLLSGKLDEAYALAEKALEILRDKDTPVILQSEVEAPAGLLVRAMDEVAERARLLILKSSVTAPLKTTGLEKFTASTRLSPTIAGA